MNEAKTFLDEVKTGLDEHYLNLWKAYVTDEPTRLFHYTSTEGLLGIAGTRTFYLSDMLASTDQSEVHHGVAIVREVLERTPDEPMSKSFLESLKAGSWWGVGTHLFVHAICFCREDDVLTQWRGYAPNSGVAIGVKFSALKSRAEQSEFALGRMLYEPDRQRDMIERTLDLGRQYLQSKRPAGTVLN